MHLEHAARCARRRACRAAAQPGDLAAWLECSAPLAATACRHCARARRVSWAMRLGGEILFWAEAARRSIESWQRDLSLTDEAVRGPAATAGSHSSQRRGKCTKRCSSAFCSIRSAGSSRSATARLRARSIQAATTCSPQRRAWRASWPSPRTTCRRATGFGSVARSRPVGHGAALISWSGSMFEYLMPSLVMRAPFGSLLEQTNRLIVQRQIQYGAELGVPWGVSESAYNARDVELTYQYSNFGVPGLGLKRGLSENAVIAPYATALAAMVDPERAALNFARLIAIGARGRYGFFEALDYTRSRLPEGSARCDRSGIHGASSGHERSRHRQRPLRRTDARTVSCGAAHPGDGTAVAGARAA